MSEKLMKISCDPMCGFTVTGHDESELITITMKHAKDTHNLSASEKETRQMMKPA